MNEDIKKFWTGPKPKRDPRRIRELALCWIEQHTDEAEAFIASIPYSTRHNLKTLPAWADTEENRMKEIRRHLMIGE